MTRIDGGTVSLVEVLVLLGVVYWYLGFLGRRYLGGA